MQNIQLLRLRMKQLGCFAFTIDLKLSPFPALMPNDCKRVVLSLDKEGLCGIQLGKLRRDLHDMLADPLFFIHEGSGDLLLPGMYRAGESNCAGARYPNTDMFLASASAYLDWVLSSVDP